MAEKKSLYASVLGNANVPRLDEYSFDDTDENGYGQLVYPQDLFNNNAYYGNCYTAFFISFKDDSVLEKTTTSVVNANARNRPSNRKNSDAVNSIASLKLDTNQSQKLSNAFVGAGAGAFIASMVGKMNIGDAIGGWKGFFVDTGVKAGGVALGGAVGNEVAHLNNENNFFNLSSDRKTQKACICLPTPAIVVNYEVNWSEETNKLMGGLLAGGTSFFTAFDGKDTDKMSAGQIATTLKDTLLKTGGNALTAMALSTPMFGTTLGLLSRSAPNPRKEQLFRDVGLREFNISYIFAPRSESEAKNVESIIKQFKYHAHPSPKDDGGFLLNYPSEFDIVHYYKGEENGHLPKHTTSVLKRVSVDYSNGNENFTFFENGMPSIIKMDLTFAEIAMLTKEDILEGF